MSMGVCGYVAWLNACSNSGGNGVLFLWNDVLPARPGPNKLTVVVVVCFVNAGVSF